MTAHAKQRGLSISTPQQPLKLQLTLQRKFLRQLQKLQALSFL
jgi:hypothetical protein